MSATNLVKSSEKRGGLNNPTGKGGFGERPQDISPGGWKKENTISYQYNRFINMSTQELNEWSKSTKPKDRTVAMDLAYRRVRAAQDSLLDMKEITDRTEGKAMQRMEVIAEVHTIDSILD